MRTRRRRAIVLAAALLAICPQLGHARPVRPDPLVAEAGCDRYRGVPVGANDSTQQFELSVCPTADGVHGKVQTSSLVSGWSVRASKGSWDADGRVLTLTETEFIESRPEPGWRFCLIDEIVLEKTAKGLEGSYVSTACDDRAELVLEKLELAAVPGAAAGSTPESDSSRPPTPVAPKSEPRTEPSPSATSGGCSCKAASPSRGDAALGIMMAFAAATVRRRRRARA